MTDQQMCLSQARQLSQPHSCFLPFTGGNVSSSTSLQPSTKEIHNKRIQGLFCFAAKLLVAGQTSDMCLY